MPMLDAEDTATAAAELLAAACINAAVVCAAVPDSDAPLTLPEVAWKAACSTAVVSAICNAAAEEEPAKSCVADWNRSNAVSSAAFR